MSTVKPPIENSFGKQRLRYFFRDKAQSAAKLDAERGSFKRDRDFISDASQQNKGRILNTVDAVLEAGSAAPIPILPRVPGIAQVVWGAGKGIAGLVAAIAGGIGSAGSENGSRRLLRSSLKSIILGGISAAGVPGARIANGVAAGKDGALDLLGVGTVEALSRPGQKDVAYLLYLLGNKTSDASGWRGRVDAKARKTAVEELKQIGAPALSEMAQALSSAEEFAPIADAMEQILRKQNFEKESTTDSAWIQPLLQIVGDGVGENSPKDRIKAALGVFSQALENKKLPPKQKKALLQALGPIVTKAISGGAEGFCYERLSAALAAGAKDDPALSKDLARSMDEALEAYAKNAQGNAHTVGALAKARASLSGGEEDSRAVGKISCAFLTSLEHGGGGIPRRSLPRCFFRTVER